jgi:Fe-S-cluster containining protein
MVDTFYLHLKFEGKAGWSINLPFLCARCGKCCTLENFLTAGPLKGISETSPQAHAAAKRLYAELGELWAQDEVQYDQHIAHTPCPFLQNNACSIYEIRPDGCRQYPNTTFGMQSTDCPALTRFKRQRAALKKGRKCTEAYYHSGNPQGKNVAEPKKPVKFTEKCYQACIVKLRQAGMSDEDLRLFDYSSGKI